MQCNCRLGFCRGSRSVAGNNARLGGGVSRRPAVETVALAVGVILPAWAQWNAARVIPVVVFGTPGLGWGRWVVRGD